MSDALSLKDAGLAIQKASHFLRPELPGMFTVHGDTPYPVAQSISAAAALEAHHALDQWDRSVKAHLGIERDRNTKNLHTSEEGIIERVAVSLHRLVGGISEEARMSTAQPHTVQTNTNVLWDYHVDCQALIHLLASDWANPPPARDDDIGPGIPAPRRPKP